MNKGIIYYTHNKLGEPIFSIVQKYILKAGLPIVSCSLEPIDFGRNITLNLLPGIQTLWEQIFSALAMSDANIVFFAEHDVLYHPSHFEFNPPRNDLFYYNVNVWRWDYPKNRAITYDRLISLSGLCANRLFALKHFEKRLDMIEKNGWDTDTSREPQWARRMGYEPGTKSIKRGGYFDEEFDTWRSEFPLVDIRHDRTFSKRKVTLDSFKHQPENWQEMPAFKILGWNLEEVFKWQN